MTDIPEVISMKVTDDWITIMKTTLNTQIPQIKTADHNAALVLC